ncbi:respiration factor rsf1 [Castilleja foliolosa]|uniref:Respiration factor rsf1 n=1 Tax=Castilleja foliolosa TaxID=1961234 RepID=A0ABD3DLV0_9LAMI
MASSSIIISLIHAHLYLSHPNVANMYSEFPKESKHSRKRTEPNMPPLNDLTWSELAKRYISAILFTTEDHNNPDKEHMDIFRCLCGDGGPKCGALNEFDGFEADALLFATSTNRIYGSLNADSDMLAVDDLDSDEKNTDLDQSTVLNKGICFWVHHLEPVKGLKTNNGAKIKKCIMNSLKNEPLVWAREILEHSVSKEVYEGNTSGMAKWRYVLIGFPDLFMFLEASDEFESSCIKEVVALHRKLKVDNQLEKQKQQKLWSSNTANLSRLSWFCRQDNIVPPAIEHVSPPWRKNYMERGNALSSCPLKEKRRNMFFLMIASQPIG